MLDVLSLGKLLPLLRLEDGLLCRRHVRLPRMASFLLSACDVRNSEAHHAEPTRSVRCKRAIRAVTLIAVVVGGTVGTALGGSKQDLQARLTARLPLGARPASTVRVEWRFVTADGARANQPRNERPMFVRLLSRTGGSPTVGRVRVVTQHAGLYEAKVRVPAGGIGGIRIGVRGRSETLFRIQNDPFTTPRGVRCDAAALGITLRAFVRAYNRGDGQRLDQLFSRQQFYWYVSDGPGPRRPPESRNRETLVFYFRERHQFGDRLELRTYRFNSYERQRNLGHFEFRGDRRADDFRDGSSFRMFGKGALNCSRQRITISVMFLGGPGQ